MNTAAEAPATLAGMVLAAGGSVRLGQPKQLCTFAGETLLNRAVRLTAGICSAGVCVVTGAFSAAVESSLDRAAAEPLWVINNANWENGMGTSIAMGMGALQACSPDGVLIMLCDQPRLSSHDLARLNALWQRAPGSPVAAAYADAIGVPAIFPRRDFARLANLGGESGARTVLAEAPDLVHCDMPAAAVDIDTPAELAALLKLENG